jgi:uncharacterized protein YceH (UPF0502 family)
MTYVTEQTSDELRAHMRRIKQMPDWHDPLADRLWREVEEQSARIASLEQEVARLRKNLDGRDDFLVKRGLFEEFMDGLRTAQQKAST